MNTKNPIDRLASALGRLPGIGEKSAMRLAMFLVRDAKGLIEDLIGALSPLDGVGPDDIRIQGLSQRLKQGGILEVILATNPNPEGEATALYLKKILSPFGTRITRIASGVPVGGTLEYSDPKTLSKALDNRTEF